MTKLGTGLWDDPSYVLGTILPKYRGFNLGSASHPFNKLYVDQIVGGAELIDNNDWLQWESSIGVDTNVLRLNSSNNVQLNAPVGQELDFDIGELRSWYINSTGQFVQDTTNGSDYVMARADKSFILGAASKESQSGSTMAYIASDATATLSNTLNFVTYGASTQAAGQDFYKTRSATPVPTTILQSGDRIASFRFFGADGTNYDQAAIMRVEVDGTPGAGTDMPGRFTFLTSADGTASPVERWRIDSTGDLKGEATNGGNIVFQLATKGIQLQSGANGRTGTFTMNGATPVVVNNTSLAAGDQIIISRDTIGGTPGAFNLTARTNGASFTVTGTAADTSGMRYTLVRIN